MKINYMTNIMTTQHKGGMLIGADTLPDTNQNRMVGMLIRKKFSLKSVFGGKHNSTKKRYFSIINLR